MTWFRESGRIAPQKFLIAPVPHRPPRKFQPKICTGLRDWCFLFGSKIRALGREMCVAEALHTAHDGLTTPKEVGVG
jgi:hypothetical protein